MRLVLKILAAATALLVLIMLLVIGDLVFNQRRMFYALLGRDALVAACAPPLADKLKRAGFEPTDVEFGDTPDITISTATGKTFADTFTFQDGAAGVRVDGILACVIRGDAVSVDFKTKATPLRAT